MGQNKYVNAKTQNGVFTLCKNALSVSFVGMAMMSGAAYAQQSFPASTRVLTPLTVTNQNDLNFGRIVAGTSRSNIRIRRNNNNLNIINGDATPVGGTVQRAGFIIAAEPLTSVQVTLPQNINIRNSNGDTMLVRRFRLNGGGGRIVSRNIDNSGNLSIFVSAQLRIEPTQAVGVYNGSYEVTVEYN